MITPSFWRGRKVLITGHTGFKGSWLSLWLQQLGAQVTGFALEPSTSPSLFTLARVSGGMRSVIGDIRDARALRTAMEEAAPEIVLHLAAQPLVLEGYRDPAGTYATNVLGTVHLFDALRHTPGVRAVVNVTTDKCYANREWSWGYRELDQLGGDDPYSSSKACAELVTMAMRASYFPPSQHRDHGVAIATARAGNVIGGGDWAQDRLVPDLLAAIVQGRTAMLRRPSAVRPWQHVLDPLAGYLMLAERLMVDGPSWGEPWNFGPDERDAQPVSWIADRLCSAWGSAARWSSDASGSAPHETSALRLDSAKSRQRLRWHPALSLEQAIAWTTRWHRAFMQDDDMQNVTRAQLRDYMALHPAAHSPTRTP